MGRVLSRVSCLAGLAGLSAASFSLALWYWGLRLLFGNVGIMVGMSDGQALALLAVSAVACCIWLLMKTRGRRFLRGSLEAYPNAAAYYGQCARAYPAQTALCATAWFSGYILSICFPGHIRYSDLGLAIAMCASMIAFSAFLLFFRLQERRICAGMKVRCVQDADESDSYDFHRERKRGVARWSAYWIVALAGYLAISIVFQNLFMYVVYFILAFANFLLRMMNNNPFRRFSGIRGKRVTVGSLNIVSALLLAGMSLYAIQNGSDYNQKYIDVSYADFIKNTKGKKIVQFGASSLWNYYMNIFSDIVEQVVDRTLFIVDNDPGKQGARWEICRKKVEIKSEEALSLQYDYAILITISMAYQEDICKQLAALHLPENIECYSLPLMTYDRCRKDHSCVERYFAEHTEPLIPARIHSFWFSGEDKPDIYKKCIESWHRYCPGYEILEWNADNYDIAKNTYMKQAYERRKWAFVSDYARLDVVHAYGGFIWIWTWNCLPP